MKGNSREKIEHLGFIKTTFYLVCLFVFLRKVKIPSLRQKYICFNFINSVCEPERVKRHSRATRHAAGFEKQPKPFVGAEEPQGPTANFHNCPNYLYIYNGETGGSSQE